MRERKKLTDWAARDKLKIKVQTSLCHPKFWNHLILVCMAYRWFSWQLPPHSFCSSRNLSIYFVLISFFTLLSLVHFISLILTNRKNILMRHYWWQVWSDNGNYRSSEFESIQWPTSKRIKEARRMRQANYMPKTFMSGCIRETTGREKERERGRGKRCSIRCHCTWRWAPCDGLHQGT